MEKEYDIGIVGGGLAGASLACCLADQPLRVAVFEEVPVNATNQPSHDDRGLALSLSSHRVLNAINVWPAVTANAVPVKHIHISDRGKFGFVRLHATDAGLPALGYVVVARELGRALVEKMASLDNVDYICPAQVTDISPGPDNVEMGLKSGEQSRTVSCRLLVAADGSDSLIRDKLGIPAEVRDYGQTAIVSNISTTLDHANTAYERFTRNGPLALLPLPDGRSVSIFTVVSSEKAAYLEMDDKEYLGVLEQTFGRRLGRFLAVGKRKAYPLRLVRSARQHQERVVLVGNAAHTLHPNGAQGYNLGLRDVAGLAEVIIKAVQQQSDPGREASLEAYLNSRSDDQARTVRCTDNLADLFYNDDTFKAAGRNLGMLLLDTCLPLKIRFIQAATGLYGRQPGLVRGLTPGQI